MSVFKNLDPKIAVTLTRGANAIIQFLIIIFYGMSLSTVEFGQLSILMILIGLNYSLIDFGTNNTVVTRKLKKTTYAGLQSLNILIAFLLGLIYFITSKVEYGILNFGNSFSDSLGYFPPLLIVYSLTIVPYARLHRALRLKQLAVVDFLPVLSMLFTVPLFLSIGYGISTLLLSVGIQVCLRLIVLKLFYRNILNIGWMKDLPFATLSRQYFSNLVVYLTSKLDQLMVAAFLTAETLGIYSFLKQMLNYPISLLMAIYSQITFPFFSRYRRVVAKINNTLTTSLLLLISIVSFYFAILFMLPDKYMQSMIGMWDFRGFLALMVMGLSISRIIFDALSTMSIAVGFISQQLKINIIYLGFVFIFGVLIPFIGLEIYVLTLSSISVLFSMFIYFSTFNKLRNKLV